MLRIIVAALLLIWLVGVLIHLAGTLIYAALVVAAIVFVYDTFVVRRKPTKKP